MPFLCQQHQKKSVCACTRIDQNCSVYTNVPHLLVLVSFFYDFYLTILLFTSSSMALTSSAALGVSELLGRADRRDAD